MSNLSNFFKALGLDFESVKSKGFGEAPIDPNVLKKLNDEFKNFKNTIDVQNRSVENLRKRLVVTQNELDNTLDPKKTAELSKALEEYNNKLDAAKEKLKHAEEDAADWLKVQGSLNKIDPIKLNEGLKSFNSFENSLTGNTKSLGKLETLTKGFFDNFSRTAGAAFSDMGSFIKTGLTNPLTAFLVVGELAAAQILELNDKLIDFQRSMGNAIGYSTIGYDNTGNSQVGGYSLQQNAGINGVSVEDILKTYNAFKQGSGVIGSVNLEENSKQLQQYGIDVARLNKLYGISSESTEKVSRVLTQQYGKGIKETSEIMEKGAKTAHQAGLNVGIFFDNLSAIADLKGQLFVRGGAQGLEDSAKVLTKLGLGAEKLTKLQESYSGFSELIDKQQKAVAMGLNNVAAAQNKIFAKIQLGKTAEALQLKLISGAKDVQQFTDKNGQITQQGIQTLSSQGYDKEEIANIERINRSAKELGVSVDQVVTGNNLTEKQRQRLSKINEKELTIKEQLLSMWSTIKSVVVDPLTSILGPIVKLVLNSVAFSFKVLNTALSPLIIRIEKVGNLLNSISGDGALVKILGSILSLLIGWKLWAMAKEAGSRIKDGIGSLFDMMSGKGGKLGKVGSFLSKSKLGSKAVGLLEKGSGFLGKGAKSLLGSGGKLFTKGIGWGALASLGGEAVGGLISGDAKEGSTRKKVGDTIGTASRWAGTGAMIGSFFGPLGTAIGAGLGGLGGIIKENWGGIKEGLGNISNSSSAVFTTLFPFAGAVIPFVKTFWSKDKEKDMKVKVASISALNSGLPEIAKIMEAKKYNISLNQKSEIENMKNSNTSASPVIVHVTNDSHMMGSLKARQAGR